MNSLVHKANVLQQTNNNGAAEIIIVRKTNILPRSRSKQGESIKRDGNKEVKDGGGGGAVQPIAVARRNARERNRVKQVNNGFANLRQHIPNFIAATFESNGRGKKLSKVETLRMAVEYIRSLEDLLALDEGSTTPSSTPGSSEEQTPPQYTYQMVHAYDDSENLAPMDDDHLLAGLEFVPGAQDLSLLNAMSVSDSLSPEMYSEQSLSPVSASVDQAGFVALAIKSEDDCVPVISLKSERNDPEGEVIDVMHWWEQQQPHT